MSEKSFHRSWISQFGLYRQVLRIKLQTVGVARRTQRLIFSLHRYDDNLRKNKRDCNICFYGITGTASIIIITVSG